MKIGFWHRFLLSMTALFGLISVGLIWSAVGEAIGIEPIMSAVIPITIIIVLLVIYYVIRKRKYKRMNDIV